MKKLLILSLLFILSTVTNVSAQIVGATKGKFNVSNGTASYSLEIVMPKGTAGLKPSLSIDYSSSNNFNGLLGVGFSLSGLSQISKCNQTLFSEKQNSSRNYNYCMDGQKLVLKNSSTTYGSNTTYKTEVDTYSKIVKSTTNWTVYTKDGLIYEYGNTSDSNDLNTFFRVNKIKDRYNNEINFKYDATTKALVQISYANNAIDLIYEDRTDTKTLYSRGAKVNLLKRLKKVSIKTNGFETSSYNLAYDFINNKSIMKSITETIDNKSLEPIVFNWEGSEIGFGNRIPYHDKNIVVNKADKFIDVDGDGYTDLLYTINHGVTDSNEEVDTSNYYVRYNKRNKFGRIEKLDTPGPEGFNIRKYTELDTAQFLQDMNADGLVDHANFSNKGDFFFLNTGNGFNPNPSDWTESNPSIDCDNSMNSETGPEALCLGYEIDEERNQYIDLNGDYLPDRIHNSDSSGLVPKNGGYWVQTNNGSKFSAYKYWGRNATEEHQYEPKWSEKSGFIDINGDGLVDRIHHYNYHTKQYGYWVQLNTGSSFGVMQNWGSNATNTNQYKLKWGANSVFLDINGDGLPDRVHHYNYHTNQYGYWVQLNTGKSFEPFKKWGQGSTTNQNQINWEYYSSYQDVNGDGLPDRVHHRNYATGETGYWVQINTGSSFSSFEKWGNDSISTYDGKSLFVDVNSDGLPDRLHFTYINSTGIWVELNQSKSFIISSITNNKDENINLEYSTLRDSSIYTSTNDLSYPNQEIKHSPMKVVKSFTISDGIGGINKTSYKYKNLARNLERGSLGFEEVETINETTNSKSIVTFNQSYPYVGTPKESKAYVNNKLMSKSIETYTQVTNASNDSYQLHKIKSTAYSYSYDSANQTVKKETINSNIDSYGNIGTIETITEGNGQTFKKTIQNTYSNYESNWILSRLDKSKVIHEAPGKSSITRESEFEYDAATGTLVKEIIEPNDVKSLNKSYVYDSKGNKTSETISSGSISPRTTTFTYDTYGKNQIKITNLLGHSETKTYNNKDQLSSVIGPNGLTTSFIYDEMGRKVEETRADGNYTTWEYSWTNDGHKVIQKLNNEYPVTVFYDKLGRKLKTVKVGFDGRNIVEENEYDFRGNKAKVSTPYFEDEEPEYIYYYYDDINRLIRLNSPGAHDTRVDNTIVYTDYATVKTNAKGQVKTTKVNVLEKTVFVNDNNESTITYEYDAIGNLLKTIDSKGNEIIIEYDNFGNKIRQIDPDMGTWTYNYNALKQLVSQTDAKAQVTSFTYDTLGRVLTKTTPEGIIEFKYDIGNKALGKVVEEKAIGSVKKYTYDNLGRVNTVTTRIDDSYEYLKQYTYDSLGRVLKTIEPNNIEIKNHYNENGYLSAVTTPRRNAGAVDTDRFRDEIAYDMQEYLKNKRLSVEYTAKINKYNLDVIRYTNIIELYKDNPAKADIVNQLKNHVNELKDLIYTLEGVVANYNKTTNTLNEADLQQWLNASQSTELASLYATFKNDLINIAEYSVSLLEELKEQKSQSPKLLYCGNVDGIIIFCPDEISHTSTNYAAEDNLLFNGTSAEIISFYETALNNLTSDVNYIKDLNQKTRYYDELSNAYTNKASAYTEILESDDIYFYKVLNQNSLGIITSYLSGNGLETTAHYDRRGIVYSMKTGYDSDSEEIRNLSFEYDSLNNVSRRVDSKLDVEHNYIYDSLNRLTYANIDTKGTSSVLSYQYDEIGNMTYKSDIGHYEYNTSRPHAVSKIGDKTFAYDANGNMTNNDGKTITYTSFNKPSQIQSANTTVTFDYDANNSRYKKTSGSDTIHYIGKSYEKNFYANGVSEDKYFIYANGKLVSIFSNKSDQYSAKFLHYDNLGSVDTITDNLGVVVERRAYKPFGKQLDLDKFGDEVQTASPTTNRGYTGHEHINEVGLIHMNGRVYDPTIARFLSADPHIQDSKDTQSYNRYTYVKNNPLKYTDPSGFFFKKFFKKFKMVVAMIVTVIIAIYAPEFLGILDKFWSAVATGALAGAAGGAILTGTLKGTLKGAIFGAISAGVAQQIGHGDIFETLRESLGGSGKHILHGLSRAIISKAQGGRWSDGFWSGFASSALAPFSKSFKDYGAKVFASAVIGGTVSQLSGGKFANGAVTGAFIFMFNDAVEDNKIKKWLTDIRKHPKLSLMFEGIEDKIEIKFGSASMKGGAMYDARNNVLIMDEAFRNGNKTFYHHTGPTFWPKVRYYSAQSVLVHELVHAYDDLNNIRYNSRRAMENNAIRIANIYRRMVNEEPRRIK